MRNCTAITKAGAPCRFSTPEGSSLCINHLPNADNAARGSSGGKARAAAAIAAKPSSDRLTTVFSLSDRTSIQAVLDTAVRLLFAGSISAPTAVLVLRYCNAAIRNGDC